jgi:hypothetical protein
VFAQQLQEVEWFITLMEGRKINLRERVSAELREPISDGMWAYLEKMSIVGDAETQPRAEQVPYLIDQIKQINYAASPIRGEVRPAGLDRPQGAAASARIDALSAVYAARAEWDTDVQFFRKSELVRRDAEGLRAYLQGRGPYPSYELLKPEDVSAWVKVQHDGISDDADGDGHVRRLVMNRQPSETSRTINLSYMDGRQERRLTVDSRGSLGRLAKVAEKLAGRYRWAPSQATDFVLTGRAPEVFVYTGSAQIRYGVDSSATTRVTMTLDPFLTPEQVAGIYSRLRAKLHEGQPPRSLSVKYYRLAEHIGPHVHFYLQDPKNVRKAGRPRSSGPNGLAQFIDPVPGYSWSTMLRDWNAKYGDSAEDGTAWRYDHLSNFTRDAQVALTRLLTPGWRMWGR